MSALPESTESTPHTQHHSKSTNHFRMEQLALGEILFVSRKNGIDSQVLIIYQMICGPSSSRASSMAFYQENLVKRELGMDSGPVRG